MKITRRAMTKEVYRKLINSFTQTKCNKTTREIEREESKKGTPFPYKHSDIILYFIQEILHGMTWLQYKSRTVC